MDVRRTVLPRLAGETIRWPSSTPTAPCWHANWTAHEIASAEQLSALHEFPGARHHILNETVHCEVASAIVEFVTAHA
jgi:alpha-beta hydrolase superfamily lysophospholipase